MAEANATPISEIDEPAPARGWLTTKIKAFGVVAFIVLAQCAAAMFLLPSAEDTAAMAQSQRIVEDALGTPEIELPPEPIDNGKPLMEVDLGEFNVAAFQPLSNTTLRIDFHMFGTVDEAESADFLAEFEQQKNRIREEVNVTVRGSNIEDLTDSGLGLIKRRILDKTNRRLGQPYLKSVIFSDFSFLEQ